MLPCSARYFERLCNSPSTRNSRGSGNTCPAGEGFCDSDESRNRFADLQRERGIGRRWAGGWEGGGGRGHQVRLSRTSGGRGAGVESNKRTRTKRHSWNPPSSVWRATRDSQLSRGEGRRESEVCVCVCVCDSQLSSNQSSTQFTRRESEKRPSRPSRNGARSSFAA